MKSPPLELWRLLAATILLAAAMASLSIPVLIPGGRLVFWIVWATLLAAALGTPFRSGIAAACSVPFVSFLLFWDLLIMWVLHGSR